MIRQKKIYVDYINYNRIAGVKENVLDVLRSDLNKLYNNLNWETEKVTETLEKSYTFKCEDKFLITMTVEENVKTATVRKRK